MLPGYKKVLEIGCAGNPMGVGSWHPEKLLHWHEPEYRTPAKNLELFCRSLPQGIDYFGIDTPKRRLARQANWVAGYNQGFQKIRVLNTRRMTPNVSFEEMDGVNLAYEDNTFEEVYLNFVLDDPTIPLEDAVQILREATRVVKPSRPVILTGNVNRQTHSRSIECMEDIVKAIAIRAGHKWPEQKDYAEKLSDAHLGEMARSYFSRQWSAEGSWGTYWIGAFLVALRK